MKRLVYVFMAFFFSCGTWAQEDEPAVVRRKPSEMPKVATSAGGFVKVVAADVPGDPMGFRLPILQFATRNLRELEKAYKLEMPRREEPGLVIYALDGRTNDTRVIVRAVRRDPRPVAPAIRGPVRHDLVRRGPGRRGGGLSPDVPHRTRRL